MNLAITSQHWTLDHWFSSPSLQAGYLAKAGKSVAVLERRHLLGGAAVTEEIVPGNRADLE